MRSFYGFDEKNNRFYFSGTEHSHSAPHIYRVKPDGTGFQRLSREEGTYSANFSPGFTHYVDNWSDINTPLQTRHYKADGTLVRFINENKVEMLSKYKLSKPEFLQVKTRDGFPMEAIMIKLPDFDSSNKYPVMSYTYTEPPAPQMRNAGAAQITCGLRCSRRKDILSGFSITARHRAKDSNKTGKHINNRVSWNYRIWKTEGFI